jgi:hypothetical protein
VRGVFDGDMSASDQTTMATIYLHVPEDLVAGLGLEPKAANFLRRTLGL